MLAQSVMLKAKGKIQKRKAESLTPKDQS